jgi:hypothetical protein
MFDLTLSASVAVLPVETSLTLDPITMALEIGQNPSGDVKPPILKITNDANPTPPSVEIGQDPSGDVKPPRPK